MTQWGVEWGRGMKLLTKERLWGAWLWGAERAGHQCEYHLCPHLSTKDHKSTSPFITTALFKSIVSHSGAIPRWHNEALPVWRSEVLGSHAHTSSSSVLQSLFQAEGHGSPCAGVTLQGPLALWTDKSECLNFKTFRKALLVAC